MTNTTYYNLNIVEGTDIVNPLTVDNPNYETIDEAMHDNAVSGVTLATEIANATVHAITRENSECAVIRFIATSEWKAGDTVTVDGVPVTALLPSGETLPDGAYVINANVLCILTGTNLTVFAGSNLDDINNRIRDLYLLSTPPIADANYAEIGVLQHVASSTANWLDTNAYLITYGGTTGQRFQYAFGINDSFVRFRVYNGISWTSWIELQQKQSALKAHTVDVELQFNSGVSSYSFDSIPFGGVSNVIVTPVGFGHQFGHIISNLTPSSYTVNIYDLVDSNYSGKVRFYITYFYV